MREFFRPHLIATIAVTMFFCPALAADVSQLAWLTGSWSGKVGNAILEENWLAPAGGTLVASVRMSNEKGTGMVEIITIRDTDSGLEFHLQQFGSDLAPRTPVQYMRLEAISEQFVSFTAPDQDRTEGLLGVSYKIDGEGQLAIEVQLAEGNTFNARLRRVSTH